MSFLVEWVLTGKILSKGEDPIFKFYIGTLLMITLSLLSQFLGENLMFGVIYFEFFNILEMGFVFLLHTRFKVRNLGNK